MTRGFETTTCGRCGGVTSKCYAEVTNGLCYSCRGHTSARPRFYTHCPHCAEELFHLPPSGMYNQKGRCNNCELLFDVGPPPNVSISAYRD